MSVSLQEKKGVYYAVFRVVDINGETKQKWVSTKVPVKRGNKREAQRAAQEIASKFEEGKIVAYPRTHSGSGLRHGWSKRRTRLTGSHFKDMPATTGTISVRISSSTT